MKPQRKIVCAALKSVEFSGSIIVCGIRHFDRIMVSQIKILKAYNSVSGIDDVTWAQGFVDNYGVFVDRQKALAIAIKAGQIVDYQYSKQTGELFSESLY